MISGTPSHHTRVQGEIPGEFDVEESLGVLAPGESFEVVAFETHGLSEEVFWYQNESGICALFAERFLGLFAVETSEY